MPERQRIDYSQLEVGYEFPPATYRFEPSSVAAYIKAVGEDSRLYQDTGLVPPMAVAALAMRALGENMVLPDGTIHVSQELEFLNTVNANDALTGYSKVSRKLVRGGFHLLTIDLTVINQHQKRVLSGKTSFVLSQVNTSKME